jgi:DUF4097 and DUF4098 domain-containing protein YvlB
MRILVIAMAALAARAAEADDDEVRASLAVRGPVTVHLETASADLEVEVHAARQVDLVVEDAPIRKAELKQSGPDRVDISFDGRGRLSTGSARLRVPKGSHLELTTLSGDIRLRGAFGQLRCRSLSGDIEADAATGAELQTISGDVVLRSVTGPVRIKTVSGDARVWMPNGSVPQLEFETTSGDLRWAGTCGAHCRVSAASMSGDVDLQLDPKSSFELRFQSHSGEISDRLGLSGLPPPQDGPGIDARGKYGGGAGVIQCHTYSGDVDLRKR